VQPALRRLPALAVLAAACYLLFFYNLTGVGLVGPDEPRYAAIGREMARSSDWLTPRLWGQPWFEKPPLLYWMTAAGFRIGLGEDLAPRLPVALFSAAFFFVFWRLLAREFGARAAWFSSAILATSAGWVALSHAAVPDLPMAAPFSLAMLLGLRWIDRGDRSGLTAAAALLGLAVLAKGLVPLALSLPLLWMGRRRWRDLARPAPVLAFLLVASPWYVLIGLRYGNAFLADLFWKHHFERFASGSLEHVQPFWFYLPVIVGALFPWSPLLALPFRREEYTDRRRRLLAAWFLFGLLFFSAARNKLPGYVLPLLPAAAALIGARLAEMRRARWLVAACAVLLALLPVVAGVLPAALQRGLSHAGLGTIAWPVMIAALALAAAAWALERAGRRGSALALAVLGVVAGAVWLEASTYPELDRTVSARGLWRQVAARRERVCVGQVNRGWRYNLNYYSGQPLPDCRETPRPLRIEQPDGGPPHLAETSLSVF
jgi:4-amino-4-deoxy-L-arabinose transferase-like glycosyltransferase